MGEPNLLGAPPPAEHLEVAVGLPFFSFPVVNHTPPPNSPLATANIFLDPNQDYSSSLVNWRYFLSSKFDEPSTPLTQWPLNSLKTSDLSPFLC